MLTYETSNICVLCRFWKLFLKNQKFIIAVLVLFTLIMVLRMTRDSQGIVIFAGFIPLSLLVNHTLQAKNLHRPNFPKQEIEDHMITEERFLMFRFLAERSPEGIGVLDANGRLLYANAALLKMHDYSAYEMLDRDFLEDLPISLETIGMKRSVKGEALRTRKNGSQFLCYFECYPLVLDKQGKPEQIAVIIRNVSKERTEVILDNITTAVLLLSIDGTIQKMNKSFQTSSGYQVSEVVGRKLSHFVTQASWAELSGRLNKLAIDKVATSIEVTVMHKDGRALTHEVSLKLISVDTYPGIVCTLQDISATKSLIRELRSVTESQKALIDLKTHMLSTVSHEYRTPLAVIRLSADILSRYEHLTSLSQKQEHIDTIQSQVDRMTELLDDVIEVNRLEMVGEYFEASWMAFDSLCAEVVRDYRRINPQLKIEFAVSGKPRPNFGDVRLLRQMISNLLSNAAKYSTAGKTIKVMLSFELKQVRLIVKDEGIGIPQAELDDLFTTFYRASNVKDIQGSGLGLAIVKRAVVMHEGTLSVESELGYGSQFSITIPLLLTKAP